jgi:hypothetical protein
MLTRSAIAGDFNGDGITDIALGAPHTTGLAGQEEAGAVFVIYGTRDFGSALTVLDLAEGAADAVIHGRDAGDLAGYSLATGDFGGDGVSGLLVGALFADGPDNTRESAGEVYGFLGAQLQGVIDLAHDEPYVTVYGANPDDRLGEAIAAGDINGDGLDDMVLAATFANGPAHDREAAGETIVLLSPRSGVIDLQQVQPDLLIVGRAAGDQLGHTIAVGDVDGDGRDDIWLGAVSADGPDGSEDLAGEAVLVLSRPGLTFVDAATRQVDALIFGPVPEARLGRWAYAVDLQGDGLADLVISAPNIPDRRGTVYIFPGSRPFPQRAGGAAVTFVGLDPGDILGHEAFGPPFASADYDGDGVVDLVMAAPRGDGPGNSRDDSGEAYIIFGGDWLPDR